MRLNPYLNFDGQCEAAFKFYERCLPGKIAFMMTYESRPGEYPVPPEWQKKILHATLLVSDQVLMGADLRRIAIKNHKASRYITPGTLPIIPSNSCNGPNGRIFFSTRSTFGSPEASL